jgi:hypothetical protein
MEFGNFRAGALDLSIALVLARIIRAGWKDLEQ